MKIHDLYKDRAGPAAHQYCSWFSPARLPGGGGGTASEIRDQTPKKIKDQRSNPQKNQRSEITDP